MVKPHPQIQRLLEVLEERGIDPLDFRRDLKISKQVWNHWVNRGIPGARIIVICQKLGCRPTWLDKGEGQVYENVGDSDEFPQGITPEALEFAQGYMILPDSIKKHVRLVINDYIGSLSPVLREAYESTRERDQLRFNRIIEAAQNEAQNERDDSE